MKLLKQTEPTVEPKLPRLRRNFAWAVAGNVVYAATQWAMLTILAKLGTQEMVGQFALGVAIATPVILFANLELQSVMVTDSNNQYRFGDYLGLRLITSALALAVVLGIAWYVSVGESYQLEKMLVILLIGLAKAVEAMSDVFYGLFLYHENQNLVAKSRIFKGLLSLMAFGGAVYLTGSLIWGIAGMIAAWALVLFGYDTRNGVLTLQQYCPRPSVLAVRKGRRSLSALCPTCEIGTLASLVWLALPMGFVVLFLSLNTNIPRYFIEYYQGERELGIFAAMAYVIQAGNIMIHALGQAAFPRLARYYWEGDRGGFLWVLLRTVNVSALLGLAGVFAAMIAGRKILTLLYTPEYAQNTDVFVWLMVAAGLTYISSAVGQGITAARHFQIQMPLFALTGGVVALACWWLVPVMGLMGAAVALVVGAVVHLCGCLAILARVLHILPKEVEV